MCMCMCIVHVHVHVHVHVRFTAGRRGPPRANAASLQRGPPGRAQHFTSIRPLRAYLGPYVLRAFRFRGFTLHARARRAQTTVSLERSLPSHCIATSKSLTPSLFSYFYTAYRPAYISPATKLYGDSTEHLPLDPLQRPCYRPTTGSYGAAPKPRLKPDHPFLPLCCLSACLPETPPPSCASSPDLLRPREHHGVASSIGVA
jgi:hypothetical protein